MKLLFFSLLSIASAHSQVHLTPTDRINLEEVPKGIIIDKKVSRGHHLLPSQRDVILKKYFEDEIKTYDDVDRDILYKCILQYPKDKLFKKYPFINERNYESVKNELL